MHTRPRLIPILVAALAVAGLSACGGAQVNKAQENIAGAGAGSTDAIAPSNGPSSVAAPETPLGPSGVYSALSDDAVTSDPGVLRIANAVRDGISSELFRGEMPGDPVVWKLATGTPVNYYVASFGGDLLCHFGVTPATVRIRGYGCGHLSEMTPGTLPFGWSTPYGVIFLVPDSVTSYSFTDSSSEAGTADVPAEGNIVVTESDFARIRVHFADGTSVDQAYPGGSDT